MQNLSKVSEREKGHEAGGEGDGKGLGAVERARNMIKLCCKEELAVCCG